MSAVLGRIRRSLLLPLFGIAAAAALVLPAGASALTGGTVAGAVSYSGASVGNFTVSLYTAAGGAVASGPVSNTSGTTGTFSIANVPAGVYYAYFDTVGAENNASTPVAEDVAQQWYGSATGTAGLSESNAAAIVVNAGTTTTLNTQALAAGGSITGTITDAATTDPLGGSISASDAAGDPATGGTTATFSATGSTPGQYTISGLPTGTYYLDVTPSGSDAAGWLVSSTVLTDFESEASGVPVTAGATPSPQSAALPVPGSITGGVTLNGIPVQDVTVDAFDSAGEEVDSQTTGSAGTYSLSGLLPGKYKLEFVPGDTNLAVQYSGGANTFAGATAETVTAGTPTAVGNAALTAGGTVSGLVINSAKTPLSNVSVELVDASGREIAGATTGADGTYTISGVPASNYFVEFVPNGAATTAYQLQYFGGKQVLAGSTPIAVTAGAATPNVDAVLVPYTTPGAVTTTTTTTPGPTTTVVETTPIPTLTGSVSISGTAKVGDALASHVSNWASGASFTYQWYVNGKAISGATGSTFTPTGADYKGTITVKATGEKSGYNWSTVSSAATKALAAGTLKAYAPTISGTAAVGKTLAAKVSGWTTGTKFSYQWYAAGKAIKGATKSSVKLASADKGKAITVKVTGKLSGYSTAAKTSKATKKAS